LLGFEVAYDEKTKRWGGYNPGPDNSLTYEFVPDEFFQGPKWIEGDTDNLPEDLKPRSALATPKAAVKGTPKGKTFGVPKEESESGTESSDENPDQQFESSSDQSESEDKSVPDLLSPIDFDPFKKPEESESDKAPSELEYVPIETDPKEEPDPNPPSPPPSPPPGPMATTTERPHIPSLLGDIPAFTGKRSLAQDFID
jgi:hypothetical protein